MQHKTLREVVKLHSRAIKTDIPHTTFTCNNLIHLYSNHGLLSNCLTLFHEIHSPNSHTWNAIISAHIRTHRIQQAHLLFNSATEKDLVTHNTILSAYASSKPHHPHALLLFSQMHSSPLPLHPLALTAMLTLSSSSSNLPFGTQLHCFLLKSAFLFNLFSLASLIHMYSKCHRFPDSLLVFTECDWGLDLVCRNAVVAACCREGEVERAEGIFMENLEGGDVVFWNTMICGFQGNGFSGDALKVFVLMLRRRVGFNEYTLVGVMGGCRDLGWLGVGKQVHGVILGRGFASNRFIASCLVDFYCKCKKMRYAEFAHFGGVGSGDSSPDPYSVSVMISGYSGAGEMERARRVFDSLEEKNPVVWTALFSGYVKCDMFGRVFDLFSEYISSSGVGVADSLVMISLLTACSRAGCLGRVKQIHSYMLRKGVEMGKKVVSCMVDSYSKCGGLIYAERIFNRIGEKDAVVYNIMIAGYGVHGNEIEAVRLFEEMRGSGGRIRPDASTFLALLSACRHRGSIETGERYFGCMVKEYNISPEIDHFSCMVDMYGRAGRVDRAAEVMGRLPLPKDTAIWGAFLNNFFMEVGVEVAKVAEEKMVGEACGGNVDRIVQIANVYAAEGRWDEVGRVRMMMRGEKGVGRKVVGCSWVYVGDRIHVFRSGDLAHPQVEAVYTMLLYITMEMGFKCSSSSFQNKT